MIGRMAVLATVGLAMATASGCSSSVANGLDAPIKAIPATDVVIETNIQAVEQATQATLETTGSFVDFNTADAGGTAVTTGPSPGPADISYALVGAGSGIILAGWNHADRHCIGVLYVHQALSTPVLGESNAGTYDFVAPASSSAACSAVALAASSGAPSAWPESPSSSGWPPA